MQEPVANQNRLEGFDEPQLHPSLPYQTDEERQWAKQKGGCF